MEEKSRQGFRVIPGGLTCETRVNRLRIVASPGHAPPFQAEARVFEEDTFLVLSADVTVRDPGRHVVRIMTDLIETEPEKPGSVIVKGSSPARYLAVVHDLELDPTWKDEWIAAALDNIFLKAAEQKIRSLALPMLGTKHGSLDTRRFVSLMCSALEQPGDGDLRDLWLIVPAGASSEIVEAIEDEIQG